MIRKIAAGFDWAKFTPVTVAPTGIVEGQFAIIDGQHRVHAAALAGLRRVPALVTDIPPAHQASCFASINSDRTNVTAFHLFKAGLAAGASWAKDAAAAVEDGGCRLMPYNKSSVAREPREIFAIGLIRRYTAQNGGAKMVSRALRALSNSTQAEDVQLYQARVLTPWLSVLWEERGLCQLDLEAFVSATDLVSVRERIGTMRNDPEFAKWSDYALAAKTFKALLHKAAKSGGIEVQS